jgi:hypothetical protein
MAGIFDPQPIFDQTVLPPDRHNLVKHFAKPVLPQATTKEAERTRIRQQVVKIHLQKIAKSDVGSTTLDHLPIRQVIVIAKILTFQQQHRRLGGSPLIRTIIGGQDLVKIIPGNDLQRLPQAVASRDVRFESPTVQLRRRRGRQFTKHQHTLHRQQDVNARS